MKIEVREEQPQDQAIIRRINETAFARAEEAEIVDRLRDSRRDLLSLVAIADGKPAGHILFSPVTIDGAHLQPQGRGLAPMAVLPGYQCLGVGSRLVREGLEHLREASIPFVIVLGHPGYYPRFGFAPASRFGIRCQWAGVPDSAFMILVLDRSALEGISGVARYADEFDLGM
jgi:putative acetyltransferase